MNLKQQEQITAQDFAKKWQKILRLQDWEVFVEVKRRRELPEDLQDCYGYCLPNLTTKQAIITIRASIDHDDQPLPFDLEQVVVHELLHLFTADLNFFEDARSLEHIAMEQMIELLSWAFITLDRKNGIHS